VRFHFALGALAYTLGSDASWQLVVGRRRRSSSWEDVLGDLMPFLVAGFAAPRSAASDARRGAA
jgi:tetracycline repressor-like protein